MLVGALIGWGWAVPHFSRICISVCGHELRTWRRAAWSHYVRFVGAGAIGVAAIWTLVKLVKPVVGGLASAMAASRARKAGKARYPAAHRTRHPDRHGRLVSLLCMMPIAGCCGISPSAAGLGAHA